MRTPRLLLAAAVTGTLVASGAGAAVHAAQPQPCGGRVRDAGNGWQSIQPNWTAGGSHIVQVVAVPYAPDRMFATNGTQVLETDNAGCSWRVLAAPQGGSLGILPAPADGVLRLPSTAQIVAIAAPSSATTSDRIYIGWNDHFTAGLTRPHITVVDANGIHDAAGLPRFGSIGALDLTATDNIPTTAYTVIDPQLGQPGGVYFTADGGLTWQQRNANERSSTLHDLRADPVVNTWLYARANGGLVRSADGGQSFEVVRRAGDVNSYDVAPGAGASMVVLGHANSRAFDRSDDGGIGWRGEKAPVFARYVAMQPILDTVAVSDGSRLWLETNGLVSRARNITPGAGSPLQIQITAPLATGYAVVGVHGDRVLRTVLDLTGKIVVGGAGRPVELLPGGVPKQFPSTLTPATTALTLPAGGHQDVAYRLLLPRTPSPVDVMFLVDTTASTDNTIAGLKRDLADIVNDLGSTGLNAEFGLADFKDYSPRIDNLGDGELGDYAYRLDRRIGPANAALRDALNRLHSRGGGDPPESQLTALYQSTTGAGQHYPGRKTYIKYLQPGQSAGYRSDALRLAVLATDERFHRERSYLTPTWQQTVSALRAYRVHPIGLAVQTVDDQGKRHGFHSLKVEQELGVDTGSLAPAGGVDCNGDLVPDIAAGAPMVCRVPVMVTPGVKVGNLVVKKSEVLPVKLAPAITTAAESLPDLRTVGLRFAGAPAGVAKVVAPVALPQVNLKNDNALTFTVRYSCPRVHQPRTFRMHVNANAGARVVATSATQLSCGGVPVVPHLPPPAALVAVPVAAAAAPAPPGQPIPNANPNPNPGLNANVGFASQEEEQRQLAFAGADSIGDEDASVEYQMSRLSRSSPDGGGSDEPWFLGGAAVLLTGAAGYAARSRFAAAWNHR